MARNCHSGAGAGCTIRVDSCSYPKSQKSLIPRSPETLSEEDLPAAFGRFTLTGIVGSGGMGRVFSAVLTGPSGFRKDVALKVIFGGDQEHLGEVRAGLGDEARIGALLKHPNIVDIYDFGEDEGLPWISMELVQGLDLQHVIERTRLCPRHVVQVGLAVAAGLEHAHALEVDGRVAGLVHRDLKPSNVLLSRDGIVKVMDFGIAKLTSEGHHTAIGVAKGTPAYMAPEQAAAGEVDGRADLWSLGAMLYQLATGEPLLQGRTVIELMMQLLQLPERLENPSALDAVDQGVSGLKAVVERLLQSDPADRYRNAGEVEEALSAVLALQPSAPSLRAFVRDLLAGGSGLDIPALSTRPAVAGLGLSVTLERTIPTNIVAESSSFLGREEALADLRALFDAGRLVTLLGPGGTGKTRLAREFALSYLPEVAQGGAWFVALDEARGIDGILHAVGRAFGVPLSKGSTDEQLARIGASLAGRGPILLMLDNVEQVVALASEVVGRWLSDAPKLRVLVTSRELLRVEGEQVLPLGPLESASAVQLFIDRAQAARARFQPSDDDREVIADIVARLDAIPLAVELAASRIGVLSPRKLQSRLSQRFRLLRGGRRGTSARQATLEGAIGWSWDLLEEHEQWTLAHCAVFHGGFTLGRAEQLIDLDRFPGQPWVLDVVEALRDKSLLRSLDGEQGEPRFSMFESIREFAAARLVELGAAHSARDSHAEVMLALGQELAAYLWGPRAVEVQDQLAEELENFASAWEHAQGTGQALLAAKLMLHMEPLLKRRGPAEFNRRMIEAADASAEHLDLATRAAIKRVLCTILRQSGKSSEALDVAWESVRLAEQSGDEILAAWNTTALGHCLRSPDGSDEVIARMEKALFLLRSHGEHGLEALVLSSYAVALGWAGRAQDEMRCHLRALDLHREGGALRMAAAEAGNIAVQYALDGEMEEAEHWMLEAYEGFRKSCDLLSAQITLGNLGTIYMAQDRRDEAALAFRRAILAAQELGLREFVALMTENQGVLAILDEDYEGARSKLDEAATLHADFEPAIHHLGLHDTHLGVLDLLTGRPEDAAQRLADACDKYRRSRTPRDLGIGLGLVAVAHARCGDESAAMAALDGSRAVADELDCDDVRMVLGYGEGHVELMRAKQARASGDAEDACLLDELAEARLDMLRMETMRPVLVRLSRRMLEQSVGAPS